LVTNAITHGDGETVTLAIRCSRGHLRIDVYDTSRSPPMAVDEPAGTETGRGLVLVAALSTEWGLFPHPRGGGRVLHARVPARSAPGRRSRGPGGHTWRL
jgi:hypothetical protein